MCDNPADDRIDGYLMCRPHIREHFAQAMEDEIVARDCTRCGDTFRSATPQRRNCQRCTDAKRGRAAAPPLQPCGSRAAYARHRNVGEQPCAPCVEAERAYQRNRRRAA